MPDITKQYDSPIEKSCDELIGVAASYSTNGKVPVTQKGFLTSFSTKEVKSMTSLISHFIGDEMMDINRLLVITRDNTAFIHRSFPVVSQARVLKSVNAGDPVYLNSIADIASISFKTNNFAVDIRDGDKLIWLFRHHFAFGLYFDLSGSLNTDDLNKELAACYRALIYREIYEALDSEEKVRLMFEKGWFPFLQIVGKESFKDLLTTLDNDIAFSKFEQKLMSEFDIESIDRITSSWWNNPTFADKKSLLEAGIELHKKNDPQSLVGAIKILATELEGVLVKEILRRTQKKPTRLEVRNFLYDLALGQFGDNGSLGFPSLFRDYISLIVYGSFSIEDNHLPYSKNLISHGLAGQNAYSQGRSLQLILSLDQVYFYFKDPVIK